MDRDVKHLNVDMRSDEAAAELDAAELADLAESSDAQERLASWTTPPPARVPSALALEFGSSLDVPLALVICSTLQTKKNETRGREAPERSFYLNEPGTLAKMSIYYVEIGFWAPQVKEHEDKTRIEKTMF